MARRWWAALAACAAISSSAAAQVACDAEGSKEVRVLGFAGNATFRARDLANRIETTQTSLARRALRVLGQRYCTDTLTVAADAARLVVYYNDRGFRGTRIDYAVQPLGARAVRVTFSIQEGAPLIIDSLQFNGLDELPDPQQFTRGLPVHVGGRYDRLDVEASRDSLVRRLRNDGYMTAEVLRNVFVDTASKRASLWYDAIPGPRMRIGAIRVQVDGPPGRSARMAPERLLAALGISEGAVLRQRDLEGVMRGLRLSEAFRHVDVALDSTSLTDAADTLADVAIRVVEGDLRASRASVGWGWYECLRLQGNVSTVNFLGGLRRLDLTGRVSRMGAGEPFGVAGGLCRSEVRRDPRADTLNYYVGATYSQPALFGRSSLPTLTLFTERRYEFSTYVRDVPFGLIGSVQRSTARIPMSLSYQFEFGATVAQPAYYCAVFSVCDPGDFRTLQDRRRTGILGWNALHSKLDDAVNPGSGYSLGVEVRHASPVVGSDPRLRFSRAALNLSGVHRLSTGTVLAARAHWGTLVGPRDRLGVNGRFVPAQERFYAGGPSSVRGYAHNQLGPIVYLVKNYDTIAQPDGTITFEADPLNRAHVRQRPDQPTGGDNVLVLNAEARIPSAFYPDLVQFAAFVDAGEVWNRRAANVGTAFSGLKVTPGAGVRVFTPVGPLRLDLAYGPRRQPLGAVYYRPDNLDEGTPVYCLSPGNGLAVNITTIPATQQGGRCVQSYRPPDRRGFRERLAFQFSIGQAF